MIVIGLPMSIRKKFEISYGEVPLMVGAVLINLIIIKLVNVINLNSINTNHSSINISLITEAATILREIKLMYVLREGQKI